MNAVAVERPRAFVAFFRDTLRWDVAFFQRVKWHWPEDLVRPVGEAIRLRRVEVSAATDRVSLPIIEKISFGGEISVTAPEDRAGYKGRLFWANAGNLVYSKIRVKQGSLAIVPDEIGELAVSAEYPVYEINAEVADSHFLALVFRSPPFMRLLEGLSHGGSTKTRIPPEEFERQLIPLPPLPMQREIAAAWQAAQKSAAATASKIERLEREIEMRFLADLGLKTRQLRTRAKAFALRWSEINRWGVELARREQWQSNSYKYGTKPLGEVCKTGTGGTPSRKRSEYFGGGIPWVKTTEVRNNCITTTEETLSSDGLANCQAKLYQAGSIVVAMYGQGATRGRTAKLGIAATTNQACLVMTEFVDGLLPDFVWYYLMARYNDLRGLASGNNQPNLSAELVRAFPVAIPPEQLQRAMIQRMETGRAEIAKLKADAEAGADAAKADIEAMILGTKPVH